VPCESECARVMTVCHVSDNESHVGQVGHTETHTCHN